MILSKNAANMLAVVVQMIYDFFDRQIGGGRKRQRERKRERQEGDPAEKEGHGGAAGTDSQMNLQMDRLYRLDRLHRFHRLNGQDRRSQTQAGHSWTKADL